MTTSTAIRTSWRCTWGTCAERWTSHSGANPSRPFAAPGIGWRPTVADRRPGRSVRARATIGATLVVAVALILGATAFFLILRSTVLDSAERSAEARADEVAGRIVTEGVGVVGGMDDEIVRVVSAEGETLAESDQMAGAAVDPGASTQLVMIDDEPNLVVADELDD